LVGKRERRGLGPVWAAYGMEKKTESNGPTWIYDFIMVFLFVDLIQIQSNSNSNDVYANLKLRYTNKCKIKCSSMKWSKQFDKSLN
jgi:hypothetical protein